MINLEDVDDMRSNTDANYGEIHNAIIQSMYDFPLSWTVESNDMFGEYGVNTFSLGGRRAKHMEIVLVHEKAKMGLRLGVTARRSFFMRRERYDFESRFLPKAPALSNKSRSISLPSAVTWLLKWNKSVTQSNFVF